MNAPARRNLENRRAVKAEAALAKTARRGQPARLTVAPDPAPPRVPRHERDLPHADPLPSWGQLKGAARYQAAAVRARGRHVHRDAGQVARWSAAGAGKAWAWWWDLATAPDHRALYRAASKAGDRKGRDGHLSAARMSFGLALCATAAALVPLPAAVAVAGRVAGLAVYVAALVAVLAAVGRRPEDHLPAPAVAAAAPVTADIILKAFDKAGFADAATVGGAAREGKGLNKRTRVLVELAPGRDSTATAVLKRREALAGNLRRDVRCVHLAEGAHPGQVIVTILDSDPMAGPPVPSPLLSAASWSLWDPLPWGFDIRGNTVHLPLLWTSLLVGAKPRMGKTFAIRTICLAACLDRHARLYLWDGKGGGDYRAFQPACERWGQGHSARKGQPAACLEMLFEVSRLVADRNDRIDRLPTHLRPEGKLTREVAENPEYGLPLVVVVVDEVQRLVADPIHGDKIRDELIALAQNAPSCGVILVVGAQRPTQQTGTGSLGDLPPAMGSRAAFKVMDAAESNVILGNGHAGAGWDASQFPDAYEGVCLLRSGADVEEGPKGVQQVKTFYANDVMLESKMVEVVAARRPGTSSGGLVLLDKPKVDDAKARLEALFNGGEDRVTVAELADRAGVETTVVRAWCREAGVVVKKIRVANTGPGQTADGVKRADVE